MPHTPGPPAFASGGAPTSAALFRVWKQKKDAFSRDLQRLVDEQRRLLAPPGPPRCENRLRSPLRRRPGPAAPPAVYPPAVNDGPRVCERGVGRILSDSAGGFYPPTGGVPGGVVCCALWGGVSGSPLRLLGKAAFLEPDASFGSPVPTVPGCQDRREGSQPGLLRGGACPGGNAGCEGSAALQLPGGVVDDRSTSPWRAGSARRGGAPDDFSFPGIHGVIASLYGLRLSPLPPPDAASTTTTTTTTAMPAGTERADPGNSAGFQRNPSEAQGAVLSVPGGTERTGPEKSAGFHRNAPETQRAGPEKSADLQRNPSEAQAFPSSARPMPGGAEGAGLEKPAGVFRRPPVTRVRPPSPGEESVSGSPDEYRSVSSAQAWVAPPAAPLLGGRATPSLDTLPQRSSAGAETPPAAGSSFHHGLAAAARGHLVVDPHSGEGTFELSSAGGAAADDGLSSYRSPSLPARARRERAASGSVGRAGGYSLDEGRGGSDTRRHGKTRSSSADRAIEWTSMARSAGGTPSPGTGHLGRGHPSDARCHGKTGSSSADRAIEWTSMARSAGGTPSPGTGYLYRGHPSEARPPTAADPAPADPLDWAARQQGFASPPSPGNPSTSPPSPGGLLPVAGSARRREASGSQPAGAYDLSSSPGNPSAGKPGASRGWPSSASPEQKQGQLSSQDVTRDFALSSSHEYPFASSGEVRFHVPGGSRGSSQGVGPSEPQDAVRDSALPSSHAYPFASSSDARFYEPGVSRGSSRGAGPSEPQDVAKRDAGSPSSREHPSAPSSALGLFEPNLRRDSSRGTTLQQEQQEYGHPSEHDAALAAGSGEQTRGHAFRSHATAYLPATPAQSAVDPLHNTLRDPLQLTLPCEDAVHYPSYPFLSALTPLPLASSSPCNPALSASEFHSPPPRSSSRGRRHRPSSSGSEDNDGRRPSRAHHQSKRTAKSFPDENLAMIRTVFSLSTSGVTEDLVPKASRVSARSGSPPEVSEGWARSPPADKPPLSRSRGGFVSFASEGSESARGEHAPGNGSPQQAKASAWSSSYGIHDTLSPLGDGTAVLQQAKASVWSSSCGIRDSASPREGDGSAATHQPKASVWASSLTNRDSSSPRGGDGPAARFREDEHTLAQPESPAQGSFGRNTNAQRIRDALPPLGVAAALQHQAEQNPDTPTTSIQAPPGTFASQCSPTSPAPFTGFQPSAEQSAAASIVRSTSSVDLVTYPTGPQASQPLGQDTQDGSSQNRGSVSALLSHARALLKPGTEADSTNRAAQAFGRTGTDDTTVQLQPTHSDGRSVSVPGKHRAESPAFSGFQSSATQEPTSHGGAGEVQLHGFSATASRVALSGGDDRRGAGSFGLRTRSEPKSRYEPYEVQLHGFSVSGSGIVLPRGDDGRGGNSTDFRSRGARFDIESERRSEPQFDEVQLHGFSVSGSAVVLPRGDDGRGAMYDFGSIGAGVDGDKKFVDVQLHGFSASMPRREDDQGASSLAFKSRGRFDSEGTPREPRFDELHLPGYSAPGSGGRDGGGASSLGSRSPAARFDAEKVSEPKGARAFSDRRASPDSWLAADPQPRAREQAGARPRLTRDSSAEAVQAWLLTYAGGAFREEAHAFEGVNGRLLLLLSQDDYTRRSPEVGGALYSAVHHEIRGKPVDPLSGSKTGYSSRQEPANLGSEAAWHKSSDGLRKSSPVNAPSGKPADPRTGYSSRREPAKSAHHGVADGEGYASDGRRRPSPAGSKTETFEAGGSSVLYPRLQGSGRGVFNGFADEEWHQSGHASGLPSTVAESKPEPGDETREVHEADEEPHGHHQVPSTAGSKPETLGPDLQSARAAGYSLADDGSGGLARSHTAQPHEDKGKPAGSKAGTFPAGNAPPSTTIQHGITSLFLPAAATRTLSQELRRARQLSFVAAALAPKAPPHPGAPGGHVQLQPLSSRRPPSPADASLLSSRISPLRKSEPASNSERFV
ncbi:hypothetical protein DIPPA_24647 [Diplonema papillatum]|nr:hypothetical protein DIPPA_24647 [Diplonema papillatum]